MYVLKKFIIGYVFSPCFIGFFVLHTSQHQHLAKLIHEASTIALRRDLEKDLDMLVKRMEAKAEQINKIQRHRARVSYPDDCFQSTVK